MKKVAVVIFSLLVLAGCASAPLKKDTALATYNTAIVKDLQVDDKTLSKIQGDEVTEFKKTEPELITLYTGNLKMELKKSGLFGNITSDEKVSGPAVIIESRTQLVDAGIRALQPTTTVIGVTVKDAETGKWIGSYQVASHTGRQVWTTMMGSLKDDFAKLGEDAANDMTKGCNDFEKRIILLKQQAETLIKQAESQK